MRSYQDDAWWGGRDRSHEHLTLLDLVRNNTLDLKLAALLWLLVEKKSSIIVAASPQLSGKTTLLTAMTDFTPPSLEKVYTRGRDEDFSFLHETDASRTYIMVSEISNHTSAYLWGGQVRTLFEAVERGYSVAATMHADSPEEIVSILRGRPINLPPELITRVHAVVNMRLAYSEHDIVRRVNRVTLVSPGPEFTLLARWNSEEDAFVHEDSPATWAKIEARLEIASGELKADLVRRAEKLESWLTTGPIGSGELQRLITEHYESL